MTFRGGHDGVDRSRKRVIDMVAVRVDRTVFFAPLLAFHRKGKGLHYVTGTQPRHDGTAGDQCLGLPVRVAQGSAAKPRIVDSSAEVPEADSTGRLFAHSFAVPRTPTNVW